MTETRVEEARKRAYQYQYEGGLIEIGQSSVYIMLGALLWAADTVKTLGISKWWLALGIICFSVIAAFCLNIFARNLRNRIVHPRTGRVSYRPNPQKEKRDAFLMVGAALVIAAVGIFLDGWYSSSTALVGAGISLTLMFTGLRTGIRRMQIVAVLPLIISMTFAYFDYDVSRASAVSIGATGVVGLALGLLALRSYLHHNPMPAEGDE